MYIEKEKMSSSFNDFDEKMKSYSLPTWEELPDIELYKDQVISIITKYLEIYYDTIGTDKIVTSSMINNYVKLGTIPAPIKKKYSKVHLAYLIIICTMKQTLDIATIQKIIPVDIDEETVRQIYNSFVNNQHTAFGYVTERVREVADPILALEGNNQERLNDLLMQVAASANIFKILTEKLTKIDG